MKELHTTLLGLAVAALMLASGCATKPTPTLKGSIGAGSGIMQSADGSIQISGQVGRGTQ